MHSLSPTWWGTLVKFSYPEYMLSFLYRIWGVIIGSFPEWSLLGSKKREPMGEMSPRAFVIKAVARDTGSHENIYVQMSNSFLEESAFLEEWFQRWKEKDDLVMGKSSKTIARNLGIDRDIKLFFLPSSWRWRHMPCSEHAIVNYAQRCEGQNTKSSFYCFKFP